MNGIKVENISYRGIEIESRQKTYTQIKRIDDFFQCVESAGFLGFFEKAYLDENNQTETVYLKKEFRVKVVLPIINEACEKLMPEWDCSISINDHADIF